MSELVRRVHTLLDTGEPPSPPEPDPELLTGDLPAVHLDGDRIAVAAADRRGLLGAIAACLAMHRLDVAGANTSTVDGRAIVEFYTEPRYGSAYEPVALAADLRRVAAGDVSVTQRVRARAMSARGGTASPRVVWHRDAATDAAVLELRAADSAGLLYRVATALDEAGADVRAARISTLGGDVVDAFYLVGSWADASERDRVGTAVLAAV
jgi:[protein-PII] uridylyltransferase